jgi:hypothetical protein
MSTSKLARDCKARLIERVCILLSYLALGIVYTVMILREEKLIRKPWTGCVTVYRQLKLF